MSFEDELTRELRARGAAARSSPDLEDLAARLRRHSRRLERRQRSLVMASALVLAASAGGLVGAIVSRPSPKTAVVSPLGGEMNGYGPAAQVAGSHAPSKGGGSSASARREHLVVARFHVAGVAVQATETGFGPPVAVTTGAAGVAGGEQATCYRAALVTTTVSRPGSFAGGTGVVGLPLLGPSGLEIVQSGELAVSSGTVVWWLTAAVGNQVARVAAEQPGGQVVTGSPTSGLVVLAGTEEVGNASNVLSAVAESSQGRSLTSIGVSVGSPPAAGGEAPQLSKADASNSCPVVLLPAGGHTGSAPSDPALAAAQVIAALETGGQRAGDLSPGTDDPTAQATAAAALPYEVRQVSFLSPTEAIVVYRLGSGVAWESATAAATSDGRWVVKL